MKTIISKFNLLFLIALAAFLNIATLNRLGVGNTYYAAGIKSMTTSFSNFFFVSFDSTGFISIDKAPLSLWLDAIFAKVFGFSGVAILLPHALAGIVVTFLVYKIVERVGGKVPAFIASLAITLSPVNIAVYRNNTPDSLLLVFILAAVYFVVRFFESKKTMFLILSAVMIGLGFNTKMLQAFLILPAITAALFVFSNTHLIQRLKIVILFLAVTLVVSFSWISIVDLTPASMRPYVGGSSNNSAWNLAIGYNGAQRLLGEQGVGGNNGFNVGDKGVQRLFTGEMGTQTGWLLASGIVFTLYFAVRNFVKILRRFIGKEDEFSTIDILSSINVLFFVTGILFFSFASFFHSYYLNILAVPIAFLVGSLVYELKKSNKYLVFSLMALASLPLQIYLIKQAEYATWLIPLITSLGVVALLLIVVNKKQTVVLGAFILGLSIFAAPLVWSGYTTLKGNTATAIFIGGPSVKGNIGMGMGRFQGYPNQMPLGMQNDGQQRQLNADDGGRGMMGGFGGQAVNATTLAYLKENYSDEKYFVAVASQGQASGFILNENITNIMTLGGFSGRDKAITLDALKTKIANNEIRFFLIENGIRINAEDGNMKFRGGMQRFGDGNMFPSQDGATQNRQTERMGGGMFNANEDITNWLKANCSAVTQITGLYDCKDVV